jgi:2'-5' RNA ligase
MDGSCGPGSPVNSFSLVAYLPEPLGGFLNQIRRELVAGCAARAHITILPPRPLAGSWTKAWTEAWDEVQRRLQGFAPFQVELGDVRVFDGSNVLYLSLISRRSELEQLNALTNTGRLHCISNFRYQPHVTLALGFAGDDVVRAQTLAQRAWQEYKGARHFLLDNLTLVQNTTDDRWIDLASLTLASLIHQ